jgi:hypothetical protein
MWPPPDQQWKVREFLSRVSHRQKMVSTCKKQTLLNKNCSFAILLHSMAHEKNVVLEVLFLYMTQKLKSGVHCVQNHRACLLKKHSSKFECMGLLFAGVMKQQQQQQK